MPEFHLRQLPVECRPLLNKFYRAHRSHMRVPAGACCWVAENTEIAAGLCVARIAEGRWLTGLLVAPNQRNQGLATRLVGRALAAGEGAVWLFCEPKLILFYQRLGFSEPATLPESLAARLQRYNRNKTLVALWHENKRAVCPLPF
ncbi:GNAT family N-acetyltransferase [Pseudomonas sp. SST3]|uniref:GNAT family N-acetyltransferase n=1 Tax=Pseudomonas sp. SST3 TaxID=2267882 RepID=UPI0014440A95|nr:GNAT family N-acetyltransferase [Pseudomonas sp. SST3]NKQ09769.1 GNAT family N-acetyltransferase [Pseudomonas sp. SST3]